MDPRALTLLLMKLLISSCDINPALHNMQIIIAEPFFPFQTWSNTDRSDLGNRFNKKPNLFISGLNFQQALRQVTESNFRGLYSTSEEKLQYLQYTGLGLCLKVISLA